MTAKRTTKTGFISTNFVLLFTAHFIVVSVYFLFITTMARHAIETFSCPDSTAGLVASIFLVGASCARIVTGRYADALGLKRCSLFALIALRPPVGKLQDKRGENVVLYPAIASMALGTLACAACTPFPYPALLLMVGFFSATGFGTCMSAGLAVVGRMSGGTRAASGIATFYLLCDFGCGIGPFLLGFIVSAFGYPAMYMACSAIALAGVAYYHLSHGRKIRTTS